MDVGKTKVMVFERKEVKVCDFSVPYRVGEPTAGRCEVFLEERS